MLRSLRSSLLNLIVVTMKFLGIALRKPTFNEITASSVMGVGLWAALIGSLRLLQVQIDRVDAGAFLVVLVWGCIGVRMGIHVGRGARHLAANMLISAGLLGMYQTALSLAG